MNSKIIVKMDFDKMEPYIQIYHELQNGQIADETLKHFVETANVNGLEIKYPETNMDNNCPQIRINHKTKSIKKAIELVPGFYESCEPLIKFLRNNYMADIKAVVSFEGAELEYKKE